MKFDRNEWSGAFGDLGTDLPLVLGVIWAAALDPVPALFGFGLLQAVTGFYYRMPMPVQPLKAMAAAVIASKLPAGALWAGAWLIAGAMLLLTATGLLERASRLVPSPVVRGVQLGLGLSLSWLALSRFIPSDGASGLALALFGLAVTLLLLGNRRFPPAPILVAAGFVYALIRPFPEMPLPVVDSAWPSGEDWKLGLLALALPQLPLSLANSVLATQRTAQDLFPASKVTLRKLGWSYAAMNAAAPLLGTLPVCHGSGGMVGHHAFGARTGDSVVIEGLLYAALAACAAFGFGQAVHLFPKPILGVILLCEGAALARLAWKTEDKPLTGALGLACLLLPYGYAAAVVAGTLYSSLKPHLSVVDPR